MRRQTEQGYACVDVLCVCVFGVFTNTVCKYNELPMGCTDNTCVEAFSACFGYLLLLL